MVEACQMLREKNDEPTGSRTASTARKLKVLSTTATITPHPSGFALAQVALAQGSATR